ncbi:PEPxxWA-CTERM sorting domain-containing protein [Sphingomonas elodea]|uniref:PEPxxWA-CTERM sorting domain-containing protein n=1 Tax=Sphingomonas elodea TaxID=179878 RepID=UPI0002631649|nr:PEPxxWA-CTERM sorting domain-containing protein [Sphingomonas elodea]
MRTRILTMLAAATVAVAAPTTASAATIIGGFQAGLANVTADTAGIGAGTTFTSGGSVVLGSYGDLSTLGLFTAFTTSSVKAALNSTASFTASFGVFSGVVTSVTTGLNTVSLYTLGTFTPTGAFSGYTAGAASVIFTFNQAGGAGNGVSGSFSLASPPSPVAEPATWGMMIAGAGLAGAALRRRRSVAKVAAA